MVRWLQTYIAPAVKNVGYFKKVTRFLICCLYVYFDCKEPGLFCDGTHRYGVPGNENDESMSVLY